MFTSIRKEGFMMEISMDMALKQAGRVNGMDLTAPKEEAVAPVEVQVNNLVDLIPKEARSVDECLPEDIKVYVQNGFFDPTMGMGQIKNKLDGKLFAYIQVSEKNTRTVHYMQKYDDGSYSAEFEISQSDLLLATMASGSGVSKMANASKNRVIKDYLDRCDGSELLNPGEVLLTLVESLHQLPVVRENAEQGRAQLYADVIDELKKMPTSGYHYNRHGGYIMLGESEIEQLADHLEMTPRKLLERLKKSRLLYLTDSCRGYQVKVATHKDESGKNVYEWCYCLYDMEYLLRKKNPKYGDPSEIETKASDFVL